MELIVFPFLSLFVFGQVLQTILFHSYQPLLTFMLTEFHPALSPVMFLLVKAQRKEVAKLKFNPWWEKEKERYLDTNIIFPAFVWCWIVWGASRILILLCIAACHSVQWTVVSLWERLWKQTPKTNIAVGIQETCAYIHPQGKMMAQCLPESRQKVKWRWAEVF